MNQLVLIAAGGAIGSVCRYLLSTSVYQLLGKTFPYGTLAVNAAGSFLVGFIFTVLLESMDGVADHLRALIIIGFLGGFTTFSTFSLETLQLLETGQLLQAAINITLSILVCIILTGAGVLLARQL